MVNTNASTSNTSTHDTSPPPSYTMATDDISLQSISKKHVKDSKPGVDVILHLLYSSAPAEEISDPENHPKTEETFPLAGTAIRGDDIENNQLHIKPSAPLIEIKPISDGPPPPYNPYYMPSGDNVTIPKTPSPSRSAPRIPDRQPERKRRTLNSNEVSSPNNGKCISPYWLLLIVPLIALTAIFIVVYGRSGIKMNDHKAVEAQRKILLEQWNNGRVFRFGSEKDRKDVAILLGHPDEKASPEEIEQWIFHQLHH